CKHPGIAEQLIEHGGAPAAAALTNLTPQSARRLVMLGGEGGELAKLSRDPKILTLLAKGNAGDTVCDWIWRNKATLALAGVGASFVANPEPYIQGTKSLVETVAKPLAETPAIIAKEGAA